jgi:hypothetical protein
MTADETSAFNQEGARFKKLYAAPHKDFSSLCRNSSLWRVLHEVNGDNSSHRLMFAVVVRFIYFLFWSGRVRPWTASEMIFTLEDSDRSIPLTAHGAKPKKK